MTNLQKKLSIKTEGSVFDSNFTHLPFQKFLPSSVLTLVTVLFFPSLNVNIAYQLVIMCVCVCVSVCECLRISISNTFPTFHRTLNKNKLLKEMGRAVAQWLRHYATNRQVAGSISDGVIGIFQCHNPSGRTMIRGSTQSLTEMSTRCVSWGVKVRKADNLTTISYRCHEI